MAGPAVKYRTVDGSSSESVFMGYIGAHRQAIMKRVFDFLPAKSKNGGLVGDYIGMVRDYPERGGKYVRPGLVMLSCEVSGGKASIALTTAAAMEISEDWILMHDDFQDHSLERRGKPAAPVLYGDELTVNAGDHLHIIMWEALLANCKELGERKSTAISGEMVSILKTTCEGQYLDIGWMQSGRFVTENQYYEMIDRKTGGYTIIGPLRLGALVAGNVKAMAPLATFGKPLGRAFQIHDDWLNVFSSKTGKELGGDILEGKRTLLLIRLLDRLEKAGKDRKARELRALFRKNRAERTWDDVREVIALYEDYGCMDWARERALGYAQEARKALAKVPYKSKEHKAILVDAIEFIVNREL
ncbi:MAG: polyprenyl synthetase family protein [Methanobacteriota archaeon]